MKSAGAMDASFHTLPHAVAIWMIQAGVTLYDVQNILGNSTRYAHLQP